LSAASAISDSLLEGRQAGTVVGRRYLLSAKWRGRYAVILIYFGSTFFYGVIFKRYATRPHGASFAHALTSLVSYLKDLPPFLQVQNGRRSRRWVGADSISMQ